MTFLVGMQTWFLGELVDEGIERALDTMVERGGVNTLLVGTHLDRQRTGDWGALTHNPRRSDLLVDGFLYDFDPAAYRDTPIKPRRASADDLRADDVFRRVVDAARPRGMRVYALVVHRFPGWEAYPDCQMVAVNGAPVPAVFCNNHPAVRAFYHAMVDDLLGRYALDGICWALLDHYVQFGFQRLTDELADTLGIKTFGAPEMGLCCFCGHCRAGARAAGIDVDRVAAGLQAGVRAGWIPHRVERLVSADEAIRFVSEVPEYLEWLRFRARGFTELHVELAEHIGARGPFEMTLDIYGPTDAWKYCSDYRALTATSRWVKPMYYSGTYPPRPQTPELVREESRKAKAEAAPGVRVMPGVYALAAQSPDTAAALTDAVVEAGADGLIVSWDYALVSLENMDAIRARLPR